MLPILTGAAPWKRSAGFRVLTGFSVHRSAVNTPAALQHESLKEIRMAEESLAVIAPVEKAPRKWEIYTLSDPRDGAVRYVGKTHCGSRRRFKNHIAEANSGKKSHKCGWIRQLIAANLKPIQAVIESGEGEGWEASEMRWIKFHRDAGCDLANETDGGEGMHGLSPSVEHREKLSAALKGVKRGPYPRERVEKQAAACRGKKWSPEMHEKMRLIYGSPEFKAKNRVKRGPAKPWTPERMEKHLAMIEGMKGRTYSDETIKKMRAGQLGKKRSPEHCAVIGNGHRGIKDSDEVRKKKSLARIGMKFTPEHIANMKACRLREWAAKKAAIAIA